MACLAEHKWVCLYVGTDENGSYSMWGCEVCDLTVLEGGG